MQRCDGAGCLPARVARRGVRPAGGACKARRDAIARPTATPACGATAARTWKWNGACRLPRNCPVSRRRRARPRRDRERTHGQKGHMLAASQVRAGAVVAIDRYLRLRVRPADTWFRSRIGRQDKGESGRGPRRGCGGAPVHCALRSDVTAANMLTWEPVCSDDGPFHARIREAAALMLVRLAGTDGWKGTCSSEHEACCAAWVPRPQ